MQITMNASDVMSALNVCALVADNSSNIDVLKSTRVTAKEGKAKFEATNNYEWAAAEFPCQGDGDFLTDTQFILSKIKTLKGEAECLFDISENQISIVSGRSKWKVPTFADAMPANTYDLPNPVRMGKDFLAAVGRVCAAADPADTRDFLKGVFVGDDVAVATDGREMRISKFSGSVGGKFTLPLGFVRKACGSFDGDVDLSFNDRMIKISSGGISLRSALVSGEYPDHARVTSSNAIGLKSKINVDRDAFLEALTASCAIGKTGERAGSYINTQIQFRADQILFYSRNSAGEEGFAECSCERDGGEDHDVGVKGDSAIGVVKAMDCDMLTIEHGGKSCAVFFEHGKDRAMLMPVMFK
jgi:DNA polymerase III sliding clamp (beta) subunit (PCNA family)